MNTLQKVSTSRFTFIVFVTVALFLIGACSNTEPESKSSEEKAPAEEGISVQQLNEEALRGVILKEYSAPDKEYNQLADTAIEATADYETQEEYDAAMNSPEQRALDAYAHEKYAQYFTANAYDTFIRTGAFRHSFGNDRYELTPSNLVITPHEEEDTFYSFTLDVTYSDGQQEEVFPIKGNAILPEAGRIGIIDFMESQGLLTKIYQ